MRLRICPTRSRWAITMFFSIAQVPKCKLHTLATTYWGSFHQLSRTCRRNSGFKLVEASTYDVQGENSRRWVRRTLSTKSEGRNKTQKSNKPTNIGREILEAKVLTSKVKNVNTIETLEIRTICDIQQQISDKNDIASLVTTLVFDLETSGCHRQKDRIIEIAIQDISGGENSTFQTLVNPNCKVLNSHVHGITTNMVNRPEVPRMEELVPILLQYVKRRQKPGGYVMLVAHNARVFDVPFLINEIARCSVDIPSDWLFMDTLPLARELMKAGGHSSKMSVSLQSLREHYQIPLVGSAHRAMSDVNTLALILQRMTFDMQLPVSGLLERCFKASDLMDAKK
uniref:Exonuclease domain-containing protein n=2 Tax=Kalanchoe fedtschenkoi TaxID=63787 RepID=A0A7N1A7X0_KALFE